MSFNAAKSQAVDNVALTWKKVPGAKGYVIMRHRSKIGTETEDKMDYYFVRQDGTVSVIGSDAEASAEVTTLVVDGVNVFTLRDTQLNTGDATEAYNQSQNKIIWGIPFTYTALPVKNILTDKDSANERFNFYANASNASSVGYTLGYGMNIKASKADYTDKVVLTWEQPAGYTKSLPHVFSRVANSTDNAWNVVGSGSLGVGDTKLEIAFDKKATGAYEYIVNYSSSPEIVSSYSEYLKADLEDKTTNEQRNKGYAFTLKGLNVRKPSATNETYDEQITWENYDFDKRAKGPGDGLVSGGNYNNVNDDCYTIYEKNLNNCTVEWFPVATMSRDGVITPLPQYKDWYDVTIEKMTGTPGVVITPKTSYVNDNGYHNGLLKVQRDYKHYYKVVAQRVNSDGDTIAATCDFDANGNDVYTYRKISGEEFAKMVTLVMADALHKCNGNGKTFNTVTQTIDGQKGNIVANVRYQFGAPVKFFFSYNFTNYKNIFEKKPNDVSDYVSAFILDSETSKEGRANNNATFELGQNTINVTHETGLPSYTGSIKLYAGKNGTDPKYHLELKYSHDSYAGTLEKNIDNNKDEFESWFPFALGVSLSSGDSTNSAYPTNNGIWWEEKE